ncbi:hypothetical protein AJ80_09601 [Polytolypa hystricis UAMH7299]|uniref:Uncharacterized protein n=1 Tax=Polytolypa hystricis (strain UAMH7299) TaxID=1447883 RepID=A0A2B7WN55_POLH7|nr:hypothetical protein AJ80_09601 [Polytolypa hystricis UAMH7299]
MRLQKPPRQWKSSNFHASSIGIPSPSRQYEMIAIQEEEEPRTTARPETEYEGHITVPAQWPTNPRKLQKWKPLNLLTDIFSLAFVAPFVVLICLVIIGNQRTALQSDWQRIQLAKNLV